MDQVCCDEGEPCIDPYIAVNVDDGYMVVCGCYLECTIDECSVGEEAEEGYCSDPSKGEDPDSPGLCINDIDFPDPFVEDDCVDGEENCETKSGETEDTICMEMVAGIGCFLTCELPEETECDDESHWCGALVNSTTGDFVGGACFPIY